MDFPDRDSDPDAPARCGSSELLRRTIARLLPTPLRVHITGETGTGKNHLAYRFRSHAEEHGKPFVEINVANLPDTLFEGELFGHRRGAFTGAQSDREGVIERAQGGVLFLNEIGELPAAGQARLLTVLDTGAYRRLGDSAERRFAARVLSATNRDLRVLVTEGRFRADLYYRIAQVTIRIPPLRERRDEIEPLVRAFLAAAAEKRGRAITIERKALRLLTADPWPGNVRELRDCVETLAFLLPDHGRLRIRAPDVRDFRQACVWRGPGDAGPDREFLRDKIERLEREEILRALIRSAGNKTRAARDLGLSIPGLRLKLRRLGLPE